LVPTQTSCTANGRVCGCRATVVLGATVVAQLSPDSLRHSGRGLGSLPDSPESVILTISVHITNEGGAHHFLATTPCFSQPFVGTSTQDTPPPWDPLGLRDLRYIENGSVFSQWHIRFKCSDGPEKWNVVLGGVAGFWQAVFPVVFFHFFAFPTVSSCLFVVFTTSPVMCRTRAATYVRTIAACSFCSHGN
jgi:hypothetical protein